MAATKRTQEHGFTLVEVLAALAIVAFVMLGTVGLFTQSMRINASGMDYITATNLARARLEQLMSLPFAAPEISYVGWTVDNGLVHLVDDSATLPDRYRDSTAGFTRSYTVREFRLLKTEHDAAGAVVTWEQQLSNAVPPGTGNLKEITVTVASVNTTNVGRREITVSAIKPAGL